MSTRLTDAELDEAFDYAHGSLRLTAALSELRERRAQNLSPADLALIDRALGVLTSDHNSVDHEAIAELRGRVSSK
jgi:hypothetical protein